MLSNTNCPYLFLAPMEGVGDRPFRKAMSSIGGFHEAVTEFIRVPRNAHVKGIARTYNSDELLPIPLAAQLMGSEPEVMAEVAREIAARGAPRIDLNCGCPSNTVTGRGAGSSLLKDPTHLYSIAAAMVKAVSVPVTVKMRTGFEDTSLFKENLLAAQESGIKFITIHPRTKVDGYGPPAKWEYIAQAKSLLTIPVVGNGDIVTVEDAVRMIETTHCDALMIGRGAVMNPFIFQQIRAHYEGTEYTLQFELLVRFFDIFTAEIGSEIADRGKISKYKQIFSFMFRGSPNLLQVRSEVLASPIAEPALFLQNALDILRKNQS